MEVTMVERNDLDSRLPLQQDADVRDKVVLVRVDHNVVKKGAIKDPYRIDATFGTLYSIVERGGLPVIMTHVGRPRDKKTGRIDTSDDTSVTPIVEYLADRLHADLAVPEMAADGERGIREVDMGGLLDDLRGRRIGGIYLPNTRWFAGEEGDDEQKEDLGRQLAETAGVFVNDAFGSWRPHASTFDVTKHLPSFAGHLMQKELAGLEKVLQPERPVVAVVAGAKYDTKIGPLTSIYEKVDRLVLGGVIYNAYLCARYGVSIEGVGEEDVEAARELVERDRREGKIVEPSPVVESDRPDERTEGAFRSVDVSDLEKGRSLRWVLDVAAEAFDRGPVAEAIASARTVFVNAVMGLTPHFAAGSEGLYRAIHANRDARVYAGGGDTLQEIKALTPGVYLSWLDGSRSYLFTGGGTVLKAIEQGTPYELPTVRALMENAGRSPG
jgi:phosphoglycerate kinase